MLWNDFYRPANLEEALGLKAELGPTARFIAGGTDIIIDLDRGRQASCHLIDLSQLTELRFIRAEAGGLRIGGGVTHAEILGSPEVRAMAGVLAQAAIEVGAPQIRNRSTLSGNIVTASPAADTVPPLLALDARVELVSQRGRREMPLTEFIIGFRKVALAEDELLYSIFIPGPQGERRGAFLKLGLRKAQAISVVSVAASLDVDREGRVLRAGIALGSVAATPIRLPEAEAILTGQILTEDLLQAAALAAQTTASPITDVRGSAAYRKAMVKVYTARALRYILTNQIPTPSADPNVFLQVSSIKYQVSSQNSEVGNMKSELSNKFQVSSFKEIPAHNKQLTTNNSAFPDNLSSVTLQVNGETVVVEEASGLALLYALRKAGLNGTKEGCLEGECGACTVLMDGKAVDSCLVPAPTAQNCQITTIEGLAKAGELHPLQKSFIEQGGVQCGYCTPGLIMAGSTFLEEHPGEFNDWQGRSALVGNLCRCTGYSKVLVALHQARTQTQEQEVKA